MIREVNSSWDNIGAKLQQERINILKKTANKRIRYAIYRSISRYVIYSYIPLRYIVERLGGNLAGISTKVVDEIEKLPHN